MATSQEYWENFNKTNAALLNAAQMLSIKQNEDKEKFKEKKKGIFDKNLDDISLYRSQGKFKTPYHVKLYQKRKAGKECCPVVEISLAAMIQTEKNKAYKKAVCAAEKQVKRRMEYNLMNVDRAFKIFVEDYLWKAFEYREKKFILDESNSQPIRNLISYFTRQQDCKLNLKKGICLYGPIGTGKSTIMKQLSKFTKDYDLKTQFDFVYMDDVYSDCDSKGLESLNDYKFSCCSFDDIGMRAENNVNNFGTKINAYKELVRRQYNRFQRTIPCLSHYTTNIQYDNKDFTSQLVKAFGGRELDRFREMCNFVELGGDSRRE